MMRVRAQARILETAVFSFWVLGTCLPSPAQTASTPASGNTGAAYRIAGTIVNQRDGSPLGRARVLASDTKDPKKYEWVITAEDGRFQFTGLPAGKYSLTGTKRGFITGSYDQHGAFSTAIVTGAGIDTENLVLKILPDAMISGKVLDETGEPVRHALVNLYLDDHRQGIKEIHLVRNSITDDLGAYELTRLAAGTYYLAASGRPWYAVHPPVQPSEGNGQKNPSVETRERSLDVVYPVTYYADVTEADSATPISIQGGERVQLDVHLNPVPALRLVFHLPDGGNAVWLEQTGFDHSAYVQSIGQTSPGVWEITGVPAGRYNVHVQGAGSNPSLEMNAVELTRDGEEIDTSSAQALSRVKVSVEVAGGAALAQGVGVGLVAEGSTQNRWQQVDRKGVAEIDQVPAGRYEVTALGPGKLYSIAKISADGTQIPGRTINVRAGSSPVLSLTLTGDSAENTELQGTVKQAGKPFAGAMVVLVPRNPGENRDRFRRDQSDLDGTFRLPGVPPGVYTIVAIENGWDLNWAEPDGIGPYLTHGHGRRVDVEHQSGHPMKLADIEVESR